MEAKAQLKYLRMAPRKVRMASDLIRGKSVNEARVILDFCLKKSARPLQKLLDSAAANAKNNLQLEQGSLVVSGIFVDEGPKLKRWRMRSRGRIAQIQKKTSYITLILKGEKTKAKPGVSPVKPIRKSEEAERKGKQPAASEEQKAKSGEKTKTRPFRKKERKTKLQTGGLKKIFRRKSF